MLLLLASCSNPRSVETFAPTEEGSAAYRFELDLSDTSVFYDLSFYGRIDADRALLDSLQALPLEVVFNAPDNTLYGESVAVPLRRDHPLSASFSVPYRSHMRPVLPGTWLLTLTAPDGLEGLQGVGIILNHD